MQRRPKNCTLMGYYAPSSGNFLQTFRDNLSIPSSRVKNPKRETAKPSQMKPKCWQTHWWSRLVLGRIAGRTPSLHHALAFALHLRKITEKPQSGHPKGAQVNSAGHDSLSRLGYRFIVTSTGRLNPVALSLRVKRLGSTLRRCRYLPIYRTKEFATSAYFESKLSVRVLMSPKKWVRAANLLLGHA